MKIINTNEMSPKDLSPFEREQVYNGLDCCVTAEVLEVLKPQLDNITTSTYEFSKALQGPVLEMRLRGVLVDQSTKAEVIETYFRKLDILERNLEQIIREGIGYVGFNWRSNADLAIIFYDELGIPIVRKEGRPTVNRDALEKISVYPSAQPIVAHLLAMRDIGKKISVLKTEIDPDGRIRTSYNIAGTETGRFSSSFSEFGTGTNLQNIEDLLRRVFVSDPGYKMAYLDAEQGESRVVGAIEWNLFQDGTYLDACESGDLHTSVAKMCWPGLAWTGNLKEDQELAEQPYYRHYSRRFMCKKIGHGTNYDGKPPTIAAQTKIERSIIEQFQSMYFKAFPAHKRWHQYVRQNLLETGIMVSLIGRKRYFFGRRDSGETQREAIAYDPQGSLADIVNAGMLNVWRHNDCQLLMQNHDAIIVQYPEDKEDSIVPRIRSCLEQSIELLHGRTLTIPYGIKTGWNFGEFCCGDKNRPECKTCNKTINIEGLKKYVGQDKRKRKQKVHLLDR